MSLESERISNSAIIGVVKKSDGEIVPMYITEGSLRGNLFVDDGSCGTLINCSQVQLVIPQLREILVKEIIGKNERYLEKVASIINIAHESINTERPTEIKAESRSEQLEYPVRGTNIFDKLFKRNQS